MNPNVFSGKTNVTFTDLIDLANENTGAKVLYANDDFFASKDNLIKSSEPIFIVDKFTEFGKWMDGWESRRKRVPGHDFCIIQLGLPGSITGLDIDTAFFTGNHPEYASIEACEMPETATLTELESTKWTEILKKSPLHGGSHNYFSIQNNSRFTHLKLHIYPDGGVARLRVYGTVKPDPSKLKGVIDLALMNNGGKVITCNDSFFGPKDNLILKPRATTLGEGWETKRKRGPGNDWIIVRLCGTGMISKIEIDTNHFKGNYPDQCSVDACTMNEPEILACDFRDKKIDWKEILPKTKLQAHTQHYFEKELLPITKSESFNFIRLNIYPDGGISRMRVYGEIKK